MKRIITDFIYPPIPVRQYDWCAWFEGEEELRHYGFGRTEQDAINNLLEQYDEGDD